MYKKFEYNLGGRPLVVEVNRVAELANGAAIIKYGDTTVLVTATASEKPRDGIDFFPLSIDYEERLYSVGKIPGGFLKREGRASERAILTSRVIDRPIRPLFPTDYRNDVAIVATVLCVDQNESPEVCAMIGASIALSISDIPLQKTVGSLNIGLVDGEFIVNPNVEQKAVSDLALTVSSTSEKVMMIEAGANEVTDETMFDAIMFGHEENKKLVAFIDSIVAEVGKEKHSYEQSGLNKEVYAKVAEIIGNERMEEAVFTDFKQIRDEKVSALKEEVIEVLSKDCAEEDLGKLLADIGAALYKFEKTTVRKMIYEDHKRPDGRKIDEIRKLTAEVDILPRTHGSAIFSRGQTQVLTVTTLGSMSEVQRLDGVDTSEDAKRYMHHYNFPSYSVGETRPSRGPGRREIGHGALAERALVPVIPSEEDFPYAIRLVSEVLSSNGSTSQASVCGSTLSLMAAGVPIKKPVAGISVGMVTAPEDTSKFVMLTDIQGIEDFFGDMDFKVAGTKDGITAIQMDIKVDGLTPEIIKQSLSQTNSARQYILDEIMLKEIATPREELSAYAPKIKLVEIPIEKIAEVIGAKGKTIKRILEESGVEKIDTSDDGKIYICDSNSENIKKAVEMIEGIIFEPEVGATYSGKVTRILNFGAFVEFAPGKEGLVHISKLASKRVEKVEDVVNVGDTVNIKVLEVDKQGRINLSIKDAN